MKDSTKAWWKDAAERLLWTFFEGATAVLGAHQIGWIDLVDGELWKAAAAGGIAASLSFIKSVAGTRLGRGGTAQMGFETYSYTEEGPGSAGPEIGNGDGEGEEAQAQGSAGGFVEPEYTDDR